MVNLKKSENCLKNIHRHRQQHVVPRGEEEREEDEEGKVGQIYGDGGIPDFGL